MAERMKTSWFVVTVVTLLVIVAATACGGDDDGGDNGSTAGPTQGGTQTAGPTAAADAGDIVQLAQAYLDGPDGKVVYNLESTNFGQHPNGTWTVYRLGESRRDDWMSAPDGILGTTIIIRTPGEDYACTVSQFTGTCSPSAEEEAASIDVIFSPVPQVAQALVASPGEAEITGLEPRTFAGVTASCWNVEFPRRLEVGPTGTESIEVCFSEDGHMLYQFRTVRFEDTSFPDATLKLEAVEIGEASESDFEPPYPE